MAEAGPKPRGLIVAAPASGTGKTTLTVGIIAALRRRGLSVAAAKVGPDYIDPRFLEAAAGRPCINLDPWAMTPDVLRGRIAALASGADLVVVEGVMGLFDGAVGGGGSTDDLARILDLPVILAVDASRQGQSIAAVVHGFATFRDHRTVAGAVATRVASDRHAVMVRSALDGIAVPYLGEFRADPAIVIESRHLGLVQAMEHDRLGELIARAADNAEQNIDLDAVLALATGIEGVNPFERMPPLGQCISVASDEAFAFLYPHILDDWRERGAEIAFFSPLADQAPAARSDAVFLPGGYPELHGARLAAATSTRAGIRRLAESGALIYGECGGYMVMGQALIDGDGARHEMLGLLGHTTSFAHRKRNLGYRRLVTLGPAPLPSSLLGHEFHYSTLADGGSDEALFHAHDSQGGDLGPIGGQRGRVMGSYAHIIDTAG